MSTQTNTNIVIKNINEITSTTVCPTSDKYTKLRLVENAINPSKYNVVGLVDRTNNVVLETRFYNIRDKKGRFARVVGNRRAR
jgi:hypothetical protein